MASRICILVCYIFSLSLSATIGDACKSDSNCGDKEKCDKDYHKGYCVRFDCSVKNPCAGEAICNVIEPEGFSVCLKSCNQKSDCRKGYRCYDQGVCLP